MSISIYGDKGKYSFLAQQGEHVLYMETGVVMDSLTQWV